MVDFGNNVQLWSWFLEEGPGQHWLEGSVTSADGQMDGCMDRWMDGAFCETKGSRVWPVNASIKMAIV